MTSSEGRHPDSDVYSDSFYEVTTAGSLEAARKVLPHLWRHRAFRSVVDVGCGIGTWLLVAKELGATTIHGFDGAYVPEGRLLIDRSAFTSTDLGESIHCDKTFELCICLEVAEHLGPGRADGLVRDLTRLSNVVAFSAAVPFQGGDGHANEIWPEYWASLFANHGYLPWGGLREAIWDLRDVPWWYRQNLILFVQRTEWDALLPGERPSSCRRLTLIHPESYLWNVRRKPRPMPTSYDFDVETYYSCTAGKLDEPPGYGPEYPAPRRDSEGE
jgi:hypothetical protein